MHVFMNKRMQIQLYVRAFLTIEQESLLNYEILIESLNFSFLILKKSQANV